MKRKEYDVAVIGAGPNGLICSAYLAKAGLKVILLEARHECGGGLDTLEFKGFRYNLHAIYHMMAEIMPVYNDFNLPQKGVRFIYPEVQAAFINKNGPPLILYKDPQQTAAYISKTFSKEDGASYLKMYQDFSEYSEKILIPLTYVPPVPPVEQVKILENARDDVGKRFNQIAEMPPIDIIEMYGFKDPVKAGLLNLFTMWGLSPYEALGYIFPLYVYRMTNAGLCMGGSHRLSSGIYRSVIENGGEICDAAEVVKVVLEGGKVSGVLLADETEISVKAVASTVDPQQNFLKFFDAHEIPAELVESTQKWEWEKTSFFGTHLALKEAPQYIGSDKCPDANNALVTFLGVNDTEKLLTHLDDIEGGKLPQSSLGGHTTCPSLFDPIQSLPGCHTGRWESLAPFDHDWEANKWDYAQRCIQEWKAYAPNLDPLHTLVYPPTYIQKKLINMVNGSIKHGAYMPLQMGYFRPNDLCSQSFTPIEGFYICGASVYPGGMVIGGPGYIGANTIVEDFELEKKWKELKCVSNARDMGLIVD